MSQIDLVNKDLELTDPTPDIENLFVLYDHQFFEGVLTSKKCTIEWSKKMTSCAGICYYKHKKIDDFPYSVSICIIRLSEPLLKLRKREDLVNTLLHEMIHGFLFCTVPNGFRDPDGHGPQFQYHVKRINSIAGTSISTFHSYNDEVRHYKQHWWRCTGSCKDRHPYYGWIKRANNRAPGPSDWWWAQHKSTCDGTFIKVKEPEKQTKNIATKSNKNKVPSKINDATNAGPSSSKQLLIDEMFSDQAYLFPDEEYDNDDIMLIGEVVGNSISLPSQINNQVKEIMEVKKSTSLPDQHAGSNNEKFPGKGYRLGTA